MKDLKARVDDAVDGMDEDMNGCTMSWFENKKTSTPTISFQLMNQDMWIIVYGIKNTIYKIVDTEHDQNISSR